MNRKVRVFNSKWSSISSSIVVQNWTSVFNNKKEVSGSSFSILNTQPTSSKLTSKCLFSLDLTSPIDTPFIGFLVIPSLFWNHSALKAMIFEKFVILKVYPLLQGQKGRTAKKISSREESFHEKASWDHAHIPASTWILLRSAPHVTRVHSSSCLQKVGEITLGFQLESHVSCHINFLNL